MTYKFKNTDENKKEVYFYLGLLSTLFAQMESKLLIIVGKHITSDFVLANTLFERNTLASNIEMLKNLNNLKDFENETVKKLVEKISNIKKIRNLFIHGVWSDPVERENDIFIICRESKLDYSEKIYNGRRDRMWGSNKSKEFRLSYIRKLVDHVEEILLIEDYLIKKFEDYDYYKDL
ncbi:hypothetical protein ACHRVW_16025 [Flavobacterium collinsii]|uniref:hypothetical protein n=1 Tax=Flavobacterium collinsii TaxID=1114861 RepID=UPI003756B058